MGSLLLVLLSATEISVTVAAGTACVSREGLAARLEKTGLVVTAGRSATLEVELAREGAFIRVRGLRRGTPLERKVSASIDDCAAVERVVAALIHSWAQSVPSSVPMTKSGAGDGGAAGPQVVTAASRSEAPGATDGTSSSPRVGDADGGAPADGLAGRRATQSVGPAVVGTGVSRQRASSTNGGAQVGFIGDGGPGSEARGVAVGRGEISPGGGVVRAEMRGVVAGGEQISPAGGGSRAEMRGVVAGGEEISPGGGGSPGEMRGVREAVSPGDGGSRGESRGVVAGREEISPGDGGSRGEMRGVVAGREEISPGDGGSRGEMRGVVAGGEQISPGGGGLPGEMRGVREAVSPGGGGSRAEARVVVDAREDRASGGGSRGEVRGVADVRAEVSPGDGGAPAEMRGVVAGREEISPGDGGARGEASGVVAGGENEALRSVGDGRSRAESLGSLSGRGSRATLTDGGARLDAFAGREGALGLETLGALRDEADAGADVRPNEVVRGSVLSSISVTPTVVPVVAASTDAGQPALLESASRLALDLSLTGGGTLGPTPSLAAIGQVGAALATRRIGVAIDLGLESERAGVVAPARVAADAQWLSLSGFLRFPFERLELRAGLGARGWRLAANASGISDAATGQVFSFGGVLWADASYRVVGPVSVRAGLFGAARWRPERFLVTGIGSVLELSPYSAGLLIGLSIRGLGE